VPQQSDAKLGDLARGSLNLFTGPFPKEGWQWHRIVPLSASSVAGRCTLDVPAGKSSYLYLRARQKNGHVAWASPVFVNYQ
jgi:hypothetical protein